MQEDLSKFAPVHLQGLVALCHDHVIVTLNFDCNIAPKLAPDFRYGPCVFFVRTEWCLFNPHNQSITRGNTNSQIRSRTGEMDCTSLTCRLSKKSHLISG